MPVITLVDTLGIQSFVFATNRLKDAVGGSAKVEQLRDWIGQTCHPGEIVVAAGGNALVRFADEGQAKQSMSKLSRLAHDEAPGMELVAVHTKYETGELATAILRAQRGLQRAKLERRPTVPALGLSVTASCHETRLPAATFDDDHRPISAAVRARRQPDFSQRWRELMPADSDRFTRDGAPHVRLEYPMELDDLGRTRDDRSLLGIVHVDGNGIGKKIAAWLRKQPESDVPDDNLIQQYRQLSGELDESGRRAFSVAVGRTIGAIEANEQKTGYRIRSTLGSGFELRMGDAEDLLYLPVRPLVLGGDDITFVCDGRLALDLAVAALESFEQSVVSWLGPIRACAGVAVSRTHAPIVRLYELATGLCRSAKGLVQVDDACAIDWHLAFSSPVESLAQLRQRQYESGGGTLTCRPFRLGAVTAPERETWRWLSNVVLGTGPLGFRGPYWSERRSKIKALREFAREGGDAVKRAMDAWRVASPQIEFPPGMTENGFFGSRTPLIDAIELLDIHLPLGGTQS